jgi:6-phosphogluconolactonase
VARDKLKVELQLFALASFRVVGLYLAMDHHRCLRLASCLSMALALAFGTVLQSAAAGHDYWVYFGTFTGQNSKGIYVSRMDADGRLTAPQLAADNDRPVFLAVARQHHFLYAANETTNFQGARAGSVSAFAIDAKTGSLKALNQESAKAPGPDHIDVDATGQIVMVANYEGSSVTSFPIKADGSVGPAASFIEQHGSSVNPQRQAAPHAHSINVDPGNHFALVCDLGLDQVLIFKIDPRKGTLTPNEPVLPLGAYDMITPGHPWYVAVKPGSGPRHLAFSPNGKFAYVISEMACSMTAFSFNPKSGAMAELQTISTLPPGTEMQTNYVAAEVVVHPSGKFRYGSNRGLDDLVV